MSFAGAAAYNLYARFIFQHKSGVRGIASTRKQLDGLHKSAQRMKSGLGMMRTGFSNVATFGAGAALAVGAIAKEGATFEKQMSVVKSIIAQSSKDGIKNFGKLESKALDLGRTTSFTATEAAQGMEQLSRAGFKWHETLSAITPVLKLAEADSMGLATASDIVASSIRAFKLEAGKAGHVADVLAYASANSNTNVTALGESMKYAASIAKTSGVNFEETVAALSMLGDIGLKGSIAGTALKNALLKINKPSQKVMKIFGGKQGWLNVMQEMKGGKMVMRNFSGRFSQVMSKLVQFKTPAEKASAMMEIFGLRGIATAGAIDSFGIKLDEAAKDDKSFEARLNALKNGAEGTANAMATMRLQNLAGQWTLFKSAVSGAAIQIYKSFGPSLTDWLQNNVIPTVTRLGEAIAAVNSGGGEGAIRARYGGGIADLIFGIKEGVSEAIKSVKSLGNTFVWTFSKLGFTSDGSRKSIIKLIAKFTTLAIVLAPIAAGFAAISMAARGAFGIISGMFRFITGTAGLVTGGLGRIMGAMRGGAGAGAAGVMGKLGKGMGRVAGIMATPVYVVNMPGGGIGGLGGGKGAGGAGGGLLGQLRRGASLGGHQGGLLSLMFGGKFAGRGASIAAASKLAAAGTALSGVAITLATLAPALAGFYALGKAYTPEGKKAKLKQLRAKAKLESPLGGQGAITDGLTAALATVGYRRFRGGNEAYTPEEQQKKFLLKHGLAEGTSSMDFFQRQAGKINKGEYGDTLSAHNQLRYNSGYTPQMIDDLYVNMQKNPMLQKALGVSFDQLIVMRAMLDKANDTEGVHALQEMLKELKALKDRPINLEVDGKAVATANKNHKNTAGERGGTPKRPKAVSASVRGDIK